MERMTTQYIYKLYFEEEQNVCYIGYTENIKDRFKAHRSTAKTGHVSKKDAWIRDRQAKGWKLKVEQLDEAPSVAAVKEMEIKYISDYKAAGYILKNSTDGGEGGTGYKHTQQAKDSMSKARKGKKHSAEWSKAIGSGNAKRYKVKTPQGQIEEFFNLGAFCREHKLSAGSLRDTMNPNTKRTHYKGYTLLEEVI